MNFIFGMKKHGGDIGQLLCFIRNQSCRYHEAKERILAELGHDETEKQIAIIKSIHGRDPAHLADAMEFLVFALENKTLGEKLPEECARVRELILDYSERGPSANFAILMMEKSLKEADRAMISGDVVLMISAYNDLKEYTS